MFAVVLAVLGLCAAQVPNPKVLWFDQTLDHFNYETNPQSFKQKYLVVDNFYVAGGPIFFYTGNEGAIGEFYNNTGFMFDIAPEFNALIVFAEHRYYGESLPFGKNSFLRNNIGYLTVEQALADYAVLLVELRSQYANAHVITFGGSYGGMLSGWMRMRYPYIVDMALAASAPYYDFSPEISPYSFFESITTTFGAANSACPGVIRAGFSQLVALSQSGAAGLNTLSQVFQLCSPLKESQIEHLILWAINSFTTLAMCDYPYPTDFLAVLPGFPVNFSCSVALSAKTPLEGLAFVAGLSYNDTTLKCFDIESEFIECSDQTGCGTGPSGTAWDYQACTENIFRPTTNNITDMFPARNWTENDLSSYCNKTFGVHPRPDWLSVEFGIANMSLTASNIIFSNGLLDPWHVGGVLKSLSATLPAIIISEGAHHLDLRASNPLDPPSVIAARQQEVAFFKLWLSELESKRQ